MYCVKVSIVVLAMVGVTMATGYGSGSGSYSSGSAGGFSGGAGGYGGGFNQNAAPQPYKFDYNAADEQGNMHYRNEEGDANGNVRGTYGYTDNQGLYRVVEYVADANGYRANIRTNEPGTDGKESPADVQMTAEQPPAGVQNAGAGARGGRSYGGGAASNYGAGASVGAGSGASGFGSAGSGFKPAIGGAGVRSGKSGY